MYEKCKFCETYWVIPKKFWTLTSRLCPESNKEVTQKDKCEKFSLTKHIPCAKYNERIAIEICLHRQKMRTHSKCSKCRQGKELLLLIMEMRKPKRIIPNRETSKPKLIRRIKK